MPALKPFKELIVIFLISFFIGLLSLVGLIIQIIKNGYKVVLYPKERLTLPAVLDNDDYGKHEYIKLKNRHIKLHCVIGGNKDKPLMLFLHGFPQFWYSWRHQIMEFQKDFRTCAIDMRGYGDSDKPQQVKDYTLDILTGDVKELIITLGYKKCILVAHDWGGAVAWTFTAFNPEMVSKLIVCNIPHPTGFLLALKSNFAQLKKSWYMFLFQVPILPTLIMRMNDFELYDKQMKSKSKPGAFSDSDIEAYKYTFNACEDYNGPLNYYRAMMRYDTFESMPRIITPTLLIWGNKDEAFINDVAPNSAKYVEDFTLEIIEGATHWVQEESHQQVCEKMREFLFVK